MGRELLHTPLLKQLRKLGVHASALAIAVAISVVVPVLVGLKISRQLSGSGGSSIAAASSGMVDAFANATFGADNITAAFNVSNVTLGAVSGALEPILANASSASDTHRGGGDDDWFGSASFFASIVASISADDIRSLFALPLRVRFADFSGFVAPVVLAHVLFAIIVQLGVLRSLIGPLAQRALHVVCRFVGLDRALLMSAAQRHELQARLLRREVRNIEHDLQNIAMEEMALQQGMAAMGRALEGDARVGAAAGAAAAGAREDELAIGANDRLENVAENANAAPVQQPLAGANPFVGDNAVVNPPNDDGGDGALFPQGGLLAAIWPGFGGLAHERAQLQRRLARIRVELAALGTCAVRCKQS